MEPPKDMCGREYKVGDYFIMGHRSGGPMSLRIGRVTEIKERQRYTSGVLLPSIRTVEHLRADPGWLRLLGKAIMESPGSHFIIPLTSVPGKYTDLLGSLVKTEWELANESNRKLMSSKTGWDLCKSLRPALPLGWKGEKEEHDFEG